MCDWAELKIGATGYEYTGLGLYDWFSYTTFSLKVNLCGNDRGRFALALEPFWIRPLEGSRDSYGINIPMAYKITDNATLRFMPAFWYSDWHPIINQFRGTAQLRYAICHNLEFYAQAFGRYTDGPSYAVNWDGSAGVGLAWHITPNIAFELASDFALDDSWSGYTLSPVLSIRF